MKPVRYILFALPLLLTGCPGKEFKPKRSPEQACNEVPPLRVSNNNQTIVMAPGETLPIMPLTGVQGFINNPTANTKIPKTVKFYGLDQLVIPENQPQGPKPPFVGGITPAGITLGAMKTDSPNRDPIEQTVTFLVGDKCAEILQDPSRMQKITFRLVMDPSLRPLTAEEKAEQLRRMKPEGVPGGSTNGSLALASAGGDPSRGGTSGMTNGTSAPAGMDSGVPFNPHKQRDDATAAPALE